MNGIVVARIRGIEVRVNWSVLIIGALLAWSLADTILPEASESHSDAEYWTAGILATVAFFGGLLAHEMGHSLVALNEGVSVKTITLWLFGGVAQLERSPESPGSALRIAAAGPAVSAAIGIVALATAALFTGLIGATLEWYGVINLILAVFNLLPAFPMDGGRIYQAWLWRNTGDEHEATRRAAQVGHSLGGGMVAFGIMMVVLWGAGGGLWLVMIGWFIREAARAELQHSTIERPLRTIPVADVMSPDPICVGAETTLADFVTGAMHRGRHAAYPVTRGGKVVGLVSLAQIQQQPFDERPAITVADIATPVEELVLIEINAGVSELLTALGARQERRALVMDQGELVGIVAPSDVTRLLAVLELMADTSVEPRHGGLDPIKGDPTCSTK